VVIEPLALAGREGPRVGPDRNIDGHADTIEAGNVRQSGHPHAGHELAKFFDRLARRASTMRAAQVLLAGRVHLPKYSDPRQAGRIVSRVWGASIYDGCGSALAQTSSAVGQGVAPRHRASREGDYG